MKLNTKLKNDYLKGKIEALEKMLYNSNQKLKVYLIGFSQEQPIEFVQKMFPEYKDIEVAFYWGFFNYSGYKIK